MNRRLSILIIILAILLSFSLHAQNDAKQRDDNQKNINAGGSLPERFNRMGEVFVQALKKEVEDIIDHNKWQEYRLKDKKIYLFISFNKVETPGVITLDSILNPGDKALNILKVAVYDMLANAIKSAINHDRKLKNHIVTLSVDTQALKAAIAESGDPMYDRDKKLNIGNMYCMNANYHFFFEAFNKTKKIVLSGRADIIEINREIASTCNYEMEVCELFEEYFKPGPPSIEEIRSDNVEVKSLKVSIICKRQGQTNSFEINPNDVLYSGDRLWLDITLPQLGGYLLVYARDSHGRVFNLFPGTGQALKEGKYKFPYHLENYTTEVLKTAREQSKDLPKNKVRIGGYTLDENTGSENIYFYYADERNKKLEEYLVKHAEGVGKDIQFKGFENTIEKYTAGDIGASISTPLLHYTETYLSLRHE